MMMLKEKAAINANICLALGPRDFAFSQMKPIDSTSVSWPSKSLSPAFNGCDSPLSCIFCYELTCSGLIEGDEEYPQEPQRTHMGETRPEKFTTLRVNVGSLTFASQILLSDRDLTDLSSLIITVDLAIAVPWSG
jgi:hypothetical protein